MVDVKQVIAALNSAIDNPDEFLVILSNGANDMTWAIGERHKITIDGVEDILTTPVLKQDSEHLGKKVLLMPCSVSEGGQKVPFTVILPLAAIRAAGKPFVLDIEIMPNPRKDNGKIVKVHSVTASGKTVSWEQFTAVDKLETFLGRELPKGRTLASIFDEAPATAKAEPVDADF